MVQDSRPSKGHWEKENIHRPAPVKNFSLPMKRGGHKERFGGRYGFPGFYKVLVSTTGLENFSFRPEKFPKKYSFGGGRVLFFFSGSGKKRHISINFCLVALGTTPGMSLGQTHFVPGTNPGFSPYFTQWKPRDCPWDKPSLSQGQSRGRRAAQKNSVLKFYVPFSLATRLTIKVKEKRQSRDQKLVMLR